MLKMLEKQIVYQIVSSLTAALYFYLFVMLLFFPASFLRDIGVETNASAEFLARRAAMLMLAFAFLAFFGRKLSQPSAKQVVTAAISLNMAGFAVMGLFEFGRGFVNAEILVIVAIEALLAVLYFLFWLSAWRMGKTRQTEQ
ncbi:MAG: hypothetical protein AB1894_18105 [Chloroflexota bacterium]